MKPIFIKKVNQLIEGGFFNLWFSHQRKPSSEHKIQVETKIVLKIEHLGVGFSIFLVLLLITILVFVGELLVNKALNRKKVKKNSVALQNLKLFKTDHGNSKVHVLKKPLRKTAKVAASKDIKKLAKKKEFLRE